MNGFVMCVYPISKRGKYCNEDCPQLYVNDFWQIKCKLADNALHVRNYNRKHHLRRVIYRSKYCIKTEMRFLQSGMTPMKL